MSWATSFGPGQGVALGSPVQETWPVLEALELFEVLVDQVGNEDWLRFRFLAPGIDKGADGLPFAEVQAVFERLCVEVAIPYLAEYGLSADVIVVTLLDRPVVFGTTDPDATQLIEAFRFKGQECAW
ncbi:MAG: DUF6497 family protein, partial [Roseobacter sp.]|nr:DUF6497 family protein [Roseobacter sp.]